MSTIYLKTMLSSGALSVIMKKGSVEGPVIMQILGCRKIKEKDTGRARYRLMLSDGVHLCTFAVLTNELANIILSGDFPLISKDKINVTNEIIPKYSIIKIKQFSVEKFTKKTFTDIDLDVAPNAKIIGRQLLIIPDFEILASSEQVGEVVGNPVPLPDDINTTFAQGDIQNDLVLKRPNMNESEASTSKRLALPNNPLNLAPINEAPTASACKQPNTTTSNAPAVESNLNISMKEEITHPISSLTPYTSKWTIKTRVVSKTPICTFSNGKGKYFKLDLIDHSGQIRCTGFDNLADKFYNSMQVDKVYYISKCRIKLVNPRFKVSNDYELIFTNDSVVQETEEETSTMPSIKFDFKRINTIATMNLGNLVDIIGICKQHSDLREFTSMKGNELKKRDLLLLDLSKTCITLTLWGANAENYNHNLPIVAVKGAKVSEFGGRINLSMPDSGIIKYNPDLKEAEAIRSWYERGGDKEECLNISASNRSGNFETKWLGFKEANLLDLGGGDKADYYQTIGMVLQLNSERTFYKGCPSANCNKKVVDLENGEYKCEKCNALYPKFEYKLMARMNIGDWSGSQWLTIFTSEAERLFGVTAKEIGETAERDEEEFLKVINKVNLKQFKFKCRAKVQMYNDECKLQTVATHVEPINYKEYNLHLISQIQQLTGCSDK